MPFTSSNTQLSSTPLNLQQKSLITQIFAVIFGTIILAVTSQITVPMIPVPITLQTLIVPLIGAFYGWRLGTLTVLAWLGEAMIGLPVLAGGSGSIASFASPTAGYLMSFPIIAAFSGYLAEKGWNGNHYFKALTSFLLANMICLIMGAAWLGYLFGSEKAIALGVIPFITGAIIKSALAAAILKAANLRQNWHQSL